MWPWPHHFASTFPSLDQARVAEVSCPSRQRGLCSGWWLLQFKYLLLMRTVIFAGFLGCIFNSYGGENRASAKHPARARALGSTSSCRIGASAGSCSPERHRRGPETPPLHFQAKSCSFPGKVSLSASFTQTKGLFPQQWSPEPSQKPARPGLPGRARCPEKVDLEQGDLSFLSPCQEVGRGGVYFLSGPGLAQIFLVTSNNTGAPRGLVCTLQLAGDGRPWRSWPFRAREKQSGHGGSHGQREAGEVGSSLRRGLQPWEERAMGPVLGEALSQPLRK